MLKCPIAEDSGVRCTRGSTTVSPRPCAASAASTAARISSSPSARRSTSGPFRYAMSIDFKGSLLLLRLDVGVAHQARPPAAFVGDQLPELRGRVAPGV